MEQLTYRIKDGKLQFTITSRQQMGDEVDYQGTFEFTINLGITVDEAIEKFDFVMSENGYDIEFPTNAREFFTSLNIF